ncbi:flagellar biosynthesis protein FlhB [Colwellia sp. RSH04]|uniref:flagellar biosynthesis protein FlhB n=1 Tax=Colwellia sp. RSH04 TaxID=2305464 RepID=UPI000E579D3A|nr:flagellar biosynthesis protein FlhB [Colwellia sp. RSH04]RHW75994.1 flagellar biosynthesis protein FlhB [Colwellia sp. RSH04]
MADDDSGEKTEDPTAKKLSDARGKGQIPRSKDMGTLFVLVGAACAMLLMGNSLASAVAAMMKRMFSLSRQEVMDVNALFKIIDDSVSLVITPLAWIFFIVVIAAFVGNVLLGGVSLSWEAAAPKASRLSPIAGFKRMLGVQAAVEFIKSLLKFFVVFICAYLLLSGLFEEILALSLEAIPNNFEHASKMLLWMFLVLALSVSIIVVIDAPYQVWNHKRQLKMTKQEIKDEHKSTEGSPEIKGRIKRTQYELSQRRMMADVPNSDVVITNPTHYSVALQYDVKVGGAPLVIAKGVDEMAIHIRTIAKEHQIEIIPAPALARSLYYSAEVGEDIPEELFAAVAQVLAFIFQLNEHKKGRAKKPIPIARNLPIPDEFKY